MENNNQDKAESTRDPGEEEDENTWEGETSSLGDYYLFAIAIDNYSKYQEPRFRRLKNPVRDAAAIVECLISNYSFKKTSTSEPLRWEEGYPDREKKIPVIEYRDRQTYCLYNRHATWKAIEEHLDYLMGKNGCMTKNDHLLIFFAGHGTRDDKMVFYDQLVSYGDFSKKLFTRELNQEVNENGTVELGGLHPSRVKNCLLVLDCCYAGAITQKNQGRPTGGSFSRKVITSTNFSEKALDGTWGQHSPFAQALLEILKENTESTANGIQAKLDTKLAVKTDGKQTVEYFNLPVALTGNLHFPFKPSSFAQHSSEEKPSVTAKTPDLPTQRIRSDNMKDTEQIRLLIRRSRIKEALKQLLPLVEDNEEHSTTVNSLVQRWSKLQRKVRMGIISSPDENVETNSIVALTLDLLNEIDQEQY